MSNNEGVYVFPDAMTKSSGIDPGLLALLNNGGGFGNNGYWLWILFMWMIWGGNGSWGNGMGGNGLLSNQFFNTEGRDMLLQAINGRADALGQLAQITHTSVETVKDGIFALQNGINQVGANVGLTAAQTQNSILLGNANLAQQLCECCCSMRYDLAQQTNALQSQAANNFAASQLQASQNHAATQLQMANIESADQLAVCQQTNTLATQADRNTNTIVKAIADQNAMIVDQFCQLKERELQSKIDTQGDIITQLRGQLDNDRQTAQLFNAINPLQAKVNEIANKQPQTVPVTWPNLQAYSVTPNINPWGYNYGGQSYWG